MKSIRIRKIEKMHSAWLRTMGLALDADARKDNDAARELRRQADKFYVKLARLCKSPDEFCRIAG